MDWNVAITNPKVTIAFNSYKRFVLNIATHYAGSRLIEQVEILQLGAGLKLALSNNFDEHVTTVRTIGELHEAITSGEYGQLSIRLAIVQLCTAFEVLFDEIANAYSITLNKNEPEISVVDARISSSPIVLGNKTIQQIRKLHASLSINSVLNKDDVLLKLTAIIEARNCITHAAGIVDAKKAERLKAYGFQLSNGDLICFDDNLFDDFFHYMTSHILAFLKKLP